MANHSTSGYQLALKLRTWKARSRSPSVSGEKLDAGVVTLPRASEVVMHSAVLGEVACGTLPNRRKLLSLWSALPPAAEVSPATVKPEKALLKAKFNQKSVQGLCKHQN